MCRCHQSAYIFPCAWNMPTVWSPYKQYLIEEVEKVQKRATKLVHECKHLPYADRLKST